jgi:ABC-type Zn uptake system ZnuABC Zn-binding protein ZnuA
MSEINTAIFPISWKIIVDKFADETSRNQPENHSYIHKNYEKLAEALWEDIHGEIKYE